MEPKIKEEVNKLTEGQKKQMTLIVFTDEEVLNFTKSGLIVRQAFPHIAISRNNSRN